MQDVVQIGLDASKVSEGSELIVYTYSSDQKLVSEHAATFVSFENNAVARTVTLLEGSRERTINLYNSGDLDEEVVAGAKRLFVCDYLEEDFASVTWH